MTRKEQIENKAILESVDMFLNSIIYTDELSCAYSDGFKDGARWADEHPCWHDLIDNPDDLPRIDEYINKIDVIVALSNGEVKVDSYMLYMNKDGDYYYDFSNYDKTINVVAWMYFPKFGN